VPIFWSDGIGSRRNHAVDVAIEWLVNQIRFWNEQYLLEAFLCHNRDWKIIGALNYLQHNYHELLKAKCPTIQPLTEPGSFYIQKVA